MAGPTYGSVGAQVAGGSSVSLPVPSGVVSGSVVILWALAYWSSGTHTAADLTVPSGFTLGGSVASTSGDSVVLAAFWKTATGSDSGTYAVSGAEALEGVAERVEMTVGSSQPWGATGLKGTVRRTSGSTVSAPAFTPSASDSLITAFAWTTSSATPGNISGGSVSWVEDVDGNNTNDDGITVSHAAMATPAAITVTYTTPGSAAYQAILAGGLVNGVSTTRITATRSTAWDTAARVDKTVGTAWNVASAVTRISKSAQVAWNVIRRLSAQASARWNVGVVSTAPFLTGVSGRHFVDQYDAPWLMRGQAGVFLLQNTALSNQLAALDFLASIDVNTVWVDLTQPAGTYSGYPVNNYAASDGTVAFTGGNFATPNEAYWTRVDSFIHHAAEVGITVGCVPLYGGTPNDLYAQGSTAWNAYGAFLAGRYGSEPNVFWIIGQDWNPSTYSTIGPMWQAFYDAFQAVSTGQLWTVEGYGQKPNDALLSSGITALSGVADFEWGYTYQAAHLVVGNAAARAATTPVTLGDGYSETAPVNNGSIPWTALSARRQAGWTYASGGSGEVYVWSSVWFGLSDYTSLAESTACAQVRHIRDAVSGVAWWTLAPSTSLITSGAGTAPSSGSNSDGGVAPSESTVAAASVAADGSLALIYMPTSRAITLDTTKLASRFTAVKIDPTTGTQTPVSAVGGSIAAPGTNASGDSDWLIVVSSLARVTATTQTAWGTLARLAGSRDTAWNVQSAATRIVATGQVAWGTLARVLDAQATAWNVGAAVSRIAASLASAWDVAEQVVASLVAAWSVNTGPFYRFTPPDIPLRPYLFDRLWSHYPLAVGVTVVRGPDGLYRRLSEPVLPEDLTEADVVYLGGHTYEIDAAAAEDLIAAGYGQWVTLEVV